MHHDGKSGNDCYSGSYIMSETRGVDDSATEWSACSAEYLKSFSKNCLDDEPGLIREDFNHERFGGRPGMYFGADSQCKLFLMDKFAMKSATTDDVCQNLRCVHSDVALQQSLVDAPDWAAGPALDGTECDIDGFCLGGECVRKKRWYVNSLAEEYYGECRSGCLERSMGVRKRVLVYDKDKVKDRGKRAANTDGTKTSKFSVICMCFFQALYPSRRSCAVTRRPARKTSQSSPPSRSAFCRFPRETASSS